MNQVCPRHSIESVTLNNLRNDHETKFIPPSPIMAFSRSSRITLLLIIDILFFLLELIVGTPLQLLIFQFSQCFVRLCSWISSTCCGQFSYAQVFVELLILTFKPLMAHLRLVML